MNERLAVIIPAYNEQSAIADVVASVTALNQRTDFAVVAVVVNDCSTDRTGEIIESLDCVSIHLPINLGIGGAVQTGFQFAFTNGFDHAIQIDGDGQHPARYIPEMLSELKSQRLDVIIGSRFITREGYQSTMARRMGIGYFHRLNKWLVGVDVRDSTSGMRLLNRKALSIVSEYYPDEYPEPEAIILYSLNGLRVGEFPVQMNSRQGGVSSIGTGSSVYYMFKVTLAILFTYLRLNFEKNSPCHASRSSP